MDGSTPARLGSEVPGFRGSEVLKSQVPRFSNCGGSNPGTRVLRTPEPRNLGTSEPIRDSVLVHRLQYVFDITDQHILGEGAVAQPS
jgi:hypothetical protein